MQVLIEKSKIRIVDVARTAGVSVGTVDRVMHNRGEVAEETRKKILSAINKLGYTPNIIARSLALRKQFRFAALLPASQEYNDYWHGPLMGVERAAMELQTYKLKVETFLFSQSDPGTFEEKAKEMLDSKPDGVIFPPLYEKSSCSLAVKCRESGIPFVLIDSNLDIDGKVSFIGQNSCQSGFLAGKLIDKMTMGKPGELMALLIGQGDKKSNQANHRMEGFVDYVSHYARAKRRIKVHWINDKARGEQNLSINDYLTKNRVAGIFIPHSRSYLLCEIADADLLQDLCIVGYDLLEKNIDCLERGIIDFLIGQNPVRQGYRAVMDMFDSIVLKKEVNKESYIPIDIIMKENYKYYLEAQL